MWYDERVRKSQNIRKPKFSLCCMQGKVSLPLKQVPPLLNDLLHNKHPKSKKFIENIRAYNMMYAFTSMGGKIDNVVDDGDRTLCIQNEWTKLPQNWKFASKTRIVS